MRHCLTVLAIAWTVSCAQAPLERQAVDDAAAALGGKDRLLAAKTLTIEGGGPAPNVGQNMVPDGELPVWQVSGTDARRIWRTRACVSSSAATRSFSLPEP